MSSINSNAGHYDNLNSSIVPLLESQSFTGVYSSILNYAVIEISINCNSKYQLDIIYSPDSISDEYTETIANDTVSASTLFYRFEPKMRYYKIVLTNNDNIDQTSLSLQCLLKSTNVFLSASNQTSNVNIINPIDSSGNVKVSVQNNLSSGGYVLLADGFIVTNSASYKIEFKYKNLTVYGSTDTNCIITLELSNDDATYYPTQYTYPVSSSDNLGFNIPAGSYNYVRFSVNTAINNLILFLNYS